MSLDDLWHKVRKFHIKFNHHISNKPSALNKEKMMKRYKWMFEELEEFKNSKNIYEQVDSMIDLLYFVLGTLVEIGIRPYKPFEIVHKANMRKLWPNNKPHYNIDGKVIKPNNWKDPYEEIKEEIDRQVASKRTRYTKSRYKYKIIKAKPFLCLAALLEIMIKSSIKKSQISQKEIGRFFGIWVPEGYKGNVKKTHITNTPNEWGIIVKNDIINKFFKTFKIPMREEFISIYNLQDWEFEDKIRELLIRGNHIICGYNYGSLYGDKQKRSGHVSLISKISKDGKYVEILDPGPDNHGYKKVRTYDLYIAIHKKKDGIWSICLT
ncbi:MAG: hypothetical protein WBB67_05315 [bacterium]